MSSAPNTGKIFKIITEQDFLKGQRKKPVRVSASALSQEIAKLAFTSQPRVKHFVQ